MSFVEGPLRIETFLSEKKTTGKISDDPDDYHSHFTQLTAKTSKGQARYRCVTCGHEFSCSGKRRKLQHILGRDFLLGKCKNRNVVPCPSPHEPLKRALLELCKLEGNESLSRLTSGIIPSRPAVSFSGVNVNQTASEISHFDQQLHEDSEFNSVIQEILSWGNEPASDTSSNSVNNQSFYSLCSESSDEGEVPSPKRIRSGYNLFSPSSSFYNSAPRSSSACSSRYSSPFTVPSSAGTPARAPLSFQYSNNNNTTSNVPLAPVASVPEIPPLPQVNTFDQYLPEPPRSFQQPQQQQSQADPARSHQINKAIYNFFSAYQIPFSALESPAFQEMVQHVQLEDSIIKQVDQIHFS